MAFVLTSLSGNLISAASAGFAPTNSADVSAIASAYQVVSATATQLNAGTAYLTSVNETPISAARAGNAANASLANSAWYDGTGRLISALPDEATVSSIASAYAESAVSSKLDESATADFYSTSNPSGFITGVDLSNYATTAYVDSSISSFVDSAYVDSQVSGKEDKLTFGYDDSAISSINGSALAGGGGKQVVTSLQYATSESATVATTVTADTAVGYGARDISAEYYDYGYGPWIEYDSSKPLVQVRMTSDGNIRNYSSYPYYLYLVPYGATNNGNVSTTSQLTDALSFGEFSGGMNDFIVAEGTGSAYSQDPDYVEVTFNVTHVPFVDSEPAYWGTVPEQHYAVVDSDEYSRPVFCVAGGNYGAELFELRGNTTAELDFGSVVTVSSVSGINNLGIYTTGGGGGGVVTSIDDDTVYVYGINGMRISAVEAYNADYAGSATRDNSGRFISSLPDSAAVSAIASAYALPKLDISALDRWQTGEEPALAYSGINGIPIHPTMADYAEEAYTAESAGSATYAESAAYWLDASSKLDESATADFYSTSNPSGFIDSAYVDSAVSSKADSSALSSYVTYSGLDYHDTAISGIDGSSLYDYSAHARISTVAGRVNNKMDSSAVQSAYASASASQATAQDVLYILIPDGV